MSEWDKLFDAANQTTLVIAQRNERKRRHSECVSYVTCARCGNRYPRGSIIGLEREFAAEEGWHTEDDRDYCPICWCKRKEA